MEKHQKQFLQNVNNFIILSNNSDNKNFSSDNMVEKMHGVKSKIYLMLLYLAFICTEMMPKRHIMCLFGL